MCVWHFQFVEKWNLRHEKAFKIHFYFSSRNNVVVMRSPTQYFHAQSQSFIQLNLNRPQLWQVCSARLLKHKMENKSNFRLFNALLICIGDINQLVIFESVNQTQNATISTAKSNRTSHNRTFSIVNKLVRQFRVCVLVI